MNQVYLSGYLGKDGELRYTKLSKPVLSLRLGVSEKKGDKPEETQWFSVTVWGFQAERLGKLAKKGARCAVLGGRLENREYQNQAGQKVAVTEVHTFNAMIEPKEEKVQAQPTPQPAWQPDLTNEDVPF